MGCSSLCFNGVFNIHDSKDILVDPEADIKSGEGKTVDSVGLALVAGPGIVAQNAYGSGPLVLRKLFQQGSGKVHLK